MKKIQHISLVNPNKVLMPFLYINLGVMKKFVKTMAKHHSNGFQYFSQKLSQTKPSKLKERIFVNPQILKILKYPEFEKALNALELQAWHACK